MLDGSPQFDAAAVDAAVQAALAQAELRTSKHRASKEYRREVLAVLLGRVLRRAFAARPGRTWGITGAHRQRSEFATFRLGTHHHANTLTDC